MSKRRQQEWTQDKFEQYLKEGRGQGSGKDYLPWITIHDFSSLGRSSRTSGWKTNRLHQFLSDHELRFFYLLEWSDIVIDIREQFPLLDIDLAVEIANNMGSKYPRDSKSNAPYVLTTDFMISVEKKGQKFDLARTIKPSRELDKKGVIEKFELERRYWAVKGIDWGIVTEREIPRGLVKNIEWIYSAYRLEATSEVELSELRAITNILKYKLENNPATINKITTHLDQELNLESGTALYLFKHLVARKEIVMDIETKIYACLSASTIKEILIDNDTKGALA